MATQPKHEEHDTKTPAEKKATKKKEALKAVDTTKPAIVPPKGHNSALLIPEVVKMMEEDLLMDDNKKAIGKDQREIRNKMKTQYHITNKAWQTEKALRKMALDARIQHESSHKDLKDMLGYQDSLDLAHGTVARTEEEHVDPSAVAGKLTGKPH